MDYGDICGSSTFTNAPPSPVIDLDALMLLWDDMQKPFLKIFKGVPIRVDEALDGNDYYCAVSQETYDALKEENEPQP